MNRGSTNKACGSRPGAWLVVSALAFGVGIGGLGCHGSSGPGAATPASGKGATSTCSAIAPHVMHFAEVLDDVGDPARSRKTSYAGVLEMLLVFERASADLRGQLADAHATDASLADMLKKSSEALAQAGDIAKAEREKIEKQATSLAPLVKDADAAYLELKAACDVKKPPRECAGVAPQLKRMEAGSFRDHLEAAEELFGMKMTTPAITKPRDRVVSTTRALGKAVEAQGAEMKALSARWAATEKTVSAAFEELGTRCKDAPRDASARFIADAKPDPRKLTLLVRVKPPAGIDDTFEELAARARDEDEKAFYEARAKGAFGSGFVLVRTKENGATETLIITNRHVVELADRASLEMADGTPLGPAEILYTDPTHDVAVLRPTKHLPFEKGFAFADVAAKDQQGVIATGFPGMAGRPSYQTTRGYVSNESFKLEEAARPLTYVQHTAPIDPGSSGGPLTDERGNVLGVNTLKVTNREAVALAVPAPSILETIRRADASEAKRSSAGYRRESSRLACLSFVSELATKKPRLAMLESMISNQLTSAEGLEAAMAIDDETFGQIWQNDSVRAMRIATLMRVQGVVALAGGTNAVETCSDVNADDSRDILNADEVRYRVRLANWESREVAFVWEQGHWKLGRMDFAPAPSVAAALAKPAPVKSAPSKPGARPSAPTARPSAPAQKPGGKPSAKPGTRK